MKNNIIKILLLGLVISSGITTYYYTKDYRKANKVYNQIEEEIQEQTDNKINYLSFGDKIYPIAQCNNNEYYLNHDWYGNKNKCGSLFFDYRCKLNNDSDLIIYGHNMKDKSMFGSLHDYEHTGGQFILNDSEYEICNTYHIKDYGSDAYLFNSFVEGNRDGFIELINSKGNVFDKIGNNDKLLILVTCDTGIDEHVRFLIVLKKK